MSVRRHAGRPEIDDFRLAHGMKETRDVRTDEAEKREIEEREEAAAGRARDGRRWTFHFDRWLPEAGTEEFVLA